MMDYELFKEVVTEKLLSHMPDELAGYSLQADRTGKVNEILDALHLMPPSCPPDSLYPTVYLNHMYEEYKKSGNLQETLELAAFYLAGACREAERKNSRITLQGAQESIIMSMVNTEQNREMLGYMPHREFEDLSIIYKYVIDTRNPVESVSVTVEMAERIGMEEEELFHAAVQNTRRLFPPTAELLNFISNEKHINGAVSMLYGEVIHGVAEQLGSDLYIMPMSVNEVMVVSTEGVVPGELAKLVEENNMSKTKLGERLSNQVYHYDKDLRKITLATDTPNKRLDGIVAEQGHVYEVNQSR